MSLQNHAAKATAIAAALGFEDAAAHGVRDREIGIAKRVLDLSLAIPLLFVLAPLLAAIAFWVWLDSPGPVLFRQRRLGLNGKPFGILKFRSMHVLEDGAQVAQASRDDARVTRAGGFLRQTSLDELPQLLNVIRGEMSLVGPRPHAIAHDRHYGAIIRDYRARQSVKPGITGWAQVNGFRGETPTVDIMRGRIEHDVWYARRASVLLDLKILVMTVGVVLKRRNAY